ncbi:MAG TPA: FHA domain-containing protein, partial [Reyranella sp.]|nr:FHA domain-containing protein [Reyranella sp.]
HGWPSQPLDETTFIMGSPPDVSCELRFFRRTISRSACLALAGTIPKTTRAVTSPSLGSLAQCAANTLQIEDLGSTNGTSVDGAVVIAGILRPLQAGARLKIGDIELSVGYG